MGWVMLAVLAVISLLSLRIIGVSRAITMMVAAALMLGCTGYALQGSPQLAGAVIAAKPSQPFDSQPNALRDDMYGRFSADFGYVIAADAMARIGDERNAVRVLIGGIARIPNSYILWSELGSVMAAHDADILSPAARFAFARAAAIAPTHPAPYYMRGLAQARAGDLALAQASWRRALSLIPPGLSYREEVRMRLALVDRLLATP